jgi:uncharacterized protein YsxB (DUF464 family)
MITAYATQRGDKSRLWIEGHASEGQDREAACAAVSALVQSLVLYAVASNARHLRYQLAPGKAFFSCHGLQRPFEMVLCGLCAIAREHPEHLQIKSAVAVNDKCDGT